MSLLPEKRAELDIDFSDAQTAYDFLVDDAFVTAIMGPVGCVSRETLVLTEHGAIPICRIDRATRVLSWDARTHQFVLSASGGGFPKGTDCLYRVSTPQGEFDAAGHHRVLCADGAYRLVRDLRAGDALSSCADTQLLTNPGAAPIASDQDDHCLTQIAAGFLARYAALIRRCGQPLLAAAGSAQVSVPSQGDVPESSRSAAPSFSLRTDGRRVQLQAHNHQDQSGDRSQTGDFFGQAVHLLRTAAGFFATEPCGHNAGLRRQGPQSLRKFVFRLTQRLFAGFVGPSVSSISDRPILSIKRQEFNSEYWDIQVLDTHNYVTADGTIHHNSGKSYACAAKLMKKALEQAPSPRDNIRYTRWAVVRNTYGELKTTTLKTWTEIFPEDKWGRINWTPPITHHIRMPKRGKVPGIDCEVMFLALDQPKDVRKLLSLNITGWWANEVRELAFQIITHLNRRAGRYPPKADGGPTWRGGFMDTNPMDNDHWYHHMAEKERPRGKYAWHFYKQPPAIFEMPDQPTEAERDQCIFAHGKWWKFNPNAENLTNLVDGYYQQQIAGSKLDEIRCYIAGQYVFVADGKPFWPEFDQDAMVGDTKFDKNTVLQLGLDFGQTLNPGAVFGQKLPNGQWQIHHEIAMEEMGLERFGQRILGDLALYFPGATVVGWGDPSAEARDPVYERVCAEYLRTIGIQVRPCETNDVDARRDAGAGPMLRRNGLVINRKCTNLIKACAGGYHFKRVRVGGKDMFRDKPNKNLLSNIGDAYGYLMLGGGEYRKLTRNPKLLPGISGGGTYQAKTDFDVFDA
jgi:hypothetical protein